MKITFLTETSGGDSDDGNERHVVLVDGKERMSQADWICPEDVRFYRDLSSPHDCEDVLKDVIAAVKRGEEVEFEYVTKEDFV